MSQILPTLPRESVDDIFRELTVTYGHAFLSRWDGLELEDVKQNWERELAPLRTRPECVQYALDHKPVRPPTAPEFLAIARSRPADPQLYLPGTDTKPAPVPAVLKPHIEKLLEPVEGRPAVRWAQQYVVMFGARVDLRVSQRQDLARAREILRREEEERRLIEARKAEAQRQEQQP